MIAVDPAIVISIVGLVVSVIALIGLIISLHLLRKQNRTAAMAQVQASFIALDSAFLGNPSLRPLFYDGTTPTLSVADGIRAEAMAEMLLDTFVLVKELDAHFGLSSLTAGWEPYMGGLIHSSPFLSGFLEKNREWYPSLAYHLSSAVRDER